MSEVLDIIKKRGVTRLCHFTKVNKMLHILSDSDGIKSNVFIEEGIIEKNDKNRFDGHEDYISTSIQYPNIWYLNKVKDLDPLFKKWVILCIDPSIIEDSRTLYCETNAATKRGALLTKGSEGLNKMFSTKTNGNRVMYRKPRMLTCCPTDDQAEVMIYGNIPRDKIIGIIVKSDKEAKDLLFMLELSNINIQIPIIIAPDVFDKKFSDQIREGIRPSENILKF